MPDCETLAAAAGREAGIPDGILPAIARVESGRNGRAWAWTLNQGGKGSYHASKEAALARLTDILATGDRNVDLGCMQINWRWHSTEFPDAASMLDPVANTRYAARFLSALHDRHGSWEGAIAAYHSTQPTRAAAYEHKVAVVRDKLLASQSPDMRADETAMPLATVGLTRGLLALSGQAVVGQSSRHDMRQRRPAGLLLPSSGAALY